MARYRKIDPRIWNDAKFSRLSNDAKLLFIYLLTSPQTQMIGAVPMRAESVAAELGFDMKRYGIGYQELYKSGIAEYDDRGLYWVKNFLKYNSPDNPKVVISWRDSLDFLPECPLLKKVIESAKSHCVSRGEGYIEAFKRGIGNSMAYGMQYGTPYKEQEQEQEQEINTNKQQTEICNEGRAREEDVCSKNFDSSLDAQADQLAADQVQEVVDDPDAIVTPVHVMALARMHGIKLYRTDKLVSVCNRKILTVDNIRRCIRIAKDEQKGGSYLIGILANAVNEPSQYHTWEYLEADKQRRAALVDENEPF